VSISPINNGKRYALWLFSAIGAQILIDQRLNLILIDTLYDEKRDSRLAAICTEFFSRNLPDLYGTLEP
jgi:hypothetical protein